MKRINYLKNIPLFAGLVNVPVVNRVFIHVTDELRFGIVDSMLFQIERIEDNVKLICNDSR